MVKHCHSYSVCGDWVDEAWHGLQVCNILRNSDHENTSVTLI